MTDEQFNHLLAFISRNNENIFLELWHVKKARALEDIERALAEKDAAIAELDAAIAENEAEMARKDLVIRKKDSIVNCDETWCKVRRFNKYMKKYMWVLVNKSEMIVIFFYDEGSRGRKVLTDFMGEAEVRAIMTDGYTAYNFLDGKLCVYHLICMARAYVKFKKAHELGKDASAIRFIELIERLYELERSYKASGYTARQIYKARQSAETSDIERRLRALLAEELKKENPRRSCYMEQALSYFDHFKDGLFLYRTDGRYPIDNNLAERQVKPFTAMRKVIQHCGGDEGAEMIAVYLSVVSTVKLAGVSVWRFFGDFFEDVVTGGRKHLGHLRLSSA